MDLNKYSIKRLREIVKYHNKNIRSAVMAYKKAELKKHIIKVTDYKTKDALVKRMMESHNQLLKGDMSLPSIDKVIKAISSKGDDAKKYYEKEIDEIADAYNTIKDKAKANEFLKYHVKELSTTGDASGYDRNLSGAELKKEIKKIAKQNLKDDKEVDDDYDKAAQSVTKKPKAVAKAKAVPKAKPVFNNLIKKVAQSKPAEQKKQIKEIVKISKKVNDKTSKLIGKTIVGKFAIELNKTSNPAKVFEELIKQYNLKNPPKSKGKGKLISEEEADNVDSDSEDLVGTPRIYNGKQYIVDDKTGDAYLMTDGEQELVGKWKDIISEKAIGKVTVSKQKQDLSDVEEILDAISQKYIIYLIDRIEDKKFGTDWKKWNKAVSESIDNYKTDSDKAGVKKSLIDMFKKDRVIPEIVETAEYYIKQFKLKGVHVMDITGKIMEDKKMPAKSK